ncbi:hypothetical protein [Kitasatospora sp. NPDC057223]|uniref:hypothetical protein n=1 Tax=Kitasatospora sp. NPDC057223 TaxID=3346055 RepID=UPI00362F9194
MAVTANGEEDSVQEQPVRVRASDGSFGVLDAGAIPGEPADYSTGLIITMPTGARIHTGIDRGPVRVTAVRVAHRPDPRSDLGGWSEVAEASVYAPQGTLRVESLDDGPVPGLPLLSPDGPGWYRLLVCARGRDNALHAVTDQPVEDYLIIAWPEPASPPILIQAADHCGHSLRLGAQDRQRSAPPVDTTYTAVEADRQAGLRAALLASMSAATPPPSATEATPPVTPDPARRPADWPSRE